MNDTKELLSDEAVVGVVGYDQVVVVENYVATSVCFVFSFVGLLVNGVVALHLRLLPTLKGSSFASLCVSMAAADCGVLAVFAFWSSPMTLTYVRSYRTWGWDARLNNT